MSLTSSTTIDSNWEAWGVLSSNDAVVQRRLGIKNNNVDRNSHHNAKTPIGRLPPEVLSEILIYVALGYYYSGSDSCRLWWIKATHVCRMFRTTALGTSRFWSYLRLTDGRVFAELVALSRNAPLHVTAEINAHKLVGRFEALQNLVEQSRRLRELRVEGTAQDVRAFFSKGVSRLDILDTLILKTTGTTRYQTDLEFCTHCVITVVPSGDIAPRLRHLELRHVPFRWLDLVPPSQSLTTLILSRSPDISGPDVGSFDEYLAALEAIAPRLERLEINDAFPRSDLDVSGASASLARHGRTIQAPRLTRVDLSGDLLSVADLLAHLALPSAVMLSVEVHGLLGSTELMDALCRIFSPPDRLVLMRFATHEFNTFTFVGQRRACDDAPLEVTFAKLGRGFLSHILPSSESESLFSRIEELELGEFSTPEWERLFGSFPRLKALSLDQHPEHEFFRALTTPLALGKGRIGVLLPALRVLKLSGFQFRSSFPQRQSSDGDGPFQGLLDWAIFRCNYGFRIDRLTLHDCPFACADDVEKLKQVVVDVEWDEWEAARKVEGEWEGEDSEGGDPEGDFFAYGEERSRDDYGDKSY
ncbi:hypothetical protein BC628DRAFT_1090948 [Trametes gibbosa]|nr:hypothetical protein BC628DRAFT_1090948 [Trametes gibbosa]